MRNLSNLLVHLFGRGGVLSRVYLSAVHDRCLLCEEPIGDSEAYLAYRVCPFCRFHYTLSARQRIELLADKKSFKESHKYLSSVAPLSFSSRGPYQNLLSQNQNRTGLTEAAVTGRCRIDGVEVMLVVLDFGFMGGSMGSVVGEKVALALETAAKREIPTVAIVTGGGVRIQEGVLSLMQMAKTVVAANRLRDKEVPFIVALANPSTGQAYASFANLADIILAEPGSLIGLSPLRTLREVSEKPLPLDAHTAESHLA
ncbi:MAG TPA: acetyl-CoA carboxylase carboxyltransferase subunit beta, partial [Dehalococcoidia bacterium]|nr:acetyl-CoA carboxylase carboxyltransferase subunit beta [Dehalococcoidia bacterium]